VPRSTSKKVKTVSQLKKEADSVFSRYIRISSSDSAGFATCATCGLSKPWKEQQAGHYISRGNNTLRYNEQNVHVQCVGCNVFKAGNYPAYALFMVRRYGQNILQDLEQESKAMKQWKPYELQELIETYKQKLEALND
jgi:hypothetical protein